MLLFCGLSGESSDGGDESFELDAPRIPRLAGDKIQRFGVESGDSRVTRQGWTLQGAMHQRSSGHTEISRISMSKGVGVSVCESKSMNTSAWTSVVEYQYVK